MYKEDLFVKHYNQIRECVIEAIIEQMFTGISQNVVLWSDGDVDCYTSNCENYLGYFTVVDGIVLYTASGSKAYCEAFEEEDEFREWCRDSIEDGLINEIMCAIKDKLLNDSICRDWWK